MTNDLSPLTWPRASWPEATDVLARSAGIFGGGRLDVQEVEVEASGLHAMLTGAPPAIVAVRAAGEERLLLVARRRRKRLVVIAPDGTEHAVAARAVSDHLRGAARAAAPQTDELRALVAGCVEAADGRGGERRPLPDDLGGAARVRGCWILRRDDGLRDGAREARLWSWLAPFLGAHALQLGLWIAAWVVLAGMAARSDLGAPHFPALVLVLGTMVVCRAAETHAARMVALGAGTAIKRRLLDDSLRLRPDEVRQKGMGHYLARVLDAEAIETAGLTGAFLALDAVGGILVTTLILARGAGGTGHALSFLAWTSVVLALSGLVYVRRSRWTDTRLALTALGVEQMVGHQTRLAQLDAARRHEGEDALLERYAVGRRGLDRATMATEMARRSWVYFGLLGLAAAFVAAGAPPEAFVVSVGGVLLGSQALSNGTQSLARLTSAVIALRNLRAFTAAAAPPVPAAPSAVSMSESAPAAGGAPLIEARDLEFSHTGRSAAVIRGAGLTIGSNDHVLLVGPSGSGKSTLAALLAGLRRPRAGLLLLRGLDHETVGGERWRRGVALAPQFQDNHLLVGTLAYNLLLGRRWPATRADLDEAAALCEELGLGPLLARMPLGLQQPVGETGWQLSHGERSRVFAARAILQRPDLLILDESFAALDAGTLARTIEIVRARCSAVMLVAHP